jgi:hypothetical protein
MQGKANWASGGMRCVHSSVILENVVIAYCKGSSGGGLFVSEYSNLTLDHVTLVNNYAPGGGHGIFQTCTVTTTLSSSIVHNLVRGGNIKLLGGNISIEYSNVLGGESEGIIANDFPVTWLEGNNDEDPLFCKSSHTDFSLAGNSPCVETGEGGSNMGACDIGCTIPLGIVVDEQSIPGSYALFQNHPNPFNPVTAISYELPEGTMVRLAVYNLQGREVARLVEGYEQAGMYEATWDGRDSDGHIVPSGIYVARLATAGYSKSIKMLLLK